MNIYQLQEKFGQKFFVWPDFFLCCILLSSIRQLVTEHGHFVKKIGPFVKNPLKGAVLLKEDDYVCSSKMRNSN